MIRAVCFDWFHTLAHHDPPRENLHCQVLSEFGISISPSELEPGLREADKFALSEALRSPNPSPEEKAKTYYRYATIMFDTVGIKADRELLLQIIKEWPKISSQTRFVLYDDVLPTMKQLQERRLVLGLLSNAKKEALLEACKRLGLEPYISFMAISMEAGAEKPHPAVFQLALQKAGVSAAEAVHVGDQYDSDVVGAKNVGMQPILIDRYGMYPEVKDCPYIRILPELLNYL